MFNENSIAAHHSVCQLLVLVMQTWMI